MPLTRTDLDRRFYLDVSADGAVFIRERGQPCTPGALPTFTVDRYGQAETIQQRFCRRANDGTGIYRLNEPPADLGALGHVTDMFRAFYEAMLAHEREIVAGIMRVEMSNDRSNHVKMHKNNLGPYTERNKMHCMDCGRSGPWPDAEPCVPKSADVARGD